MRDQLKSPETVVVAVVLDIFIDVAVIVVADGVFYVVVLLTSLFWPCLLLRTTFYFTCGQ